MLQKFLRVCFSILGVLLGSALAQMVIINEWIQATLRIQFTPEIELGTYIVIMVLCGLIFFIFFPLILKGVKNLTKMVEASMEDVRLVDIALGVGALLFIRSRFRGSAAF